MKHLTNCWPCTRCPNFVCDQRFRQPEPCLRCSRPLKGCLKRSRAISGFCDSSVFFKKMGDQMPCNDTARGEHGRESQRYPKYLTAREWALISPMLPAAKRGGRPRTTDLRAVMDAILYITSSGVPVAHAAEGLPAGLHGSASFLRLARHRPVAGHQPPAGHERWGPGRLRR